MWFKTKCLNAQTKELKKRAEFCINTGMNTGDSTSEYAITKDCDRKPDQKSNRTLMTPLLTI